MVHRGFLTFILTISAVMNTTYAQSVSINVDSHLPEAQAALHKASKSTSEMNQQRGSFGPQGSKYKDIFGVNGRRESSVVRFGVSRSWFARLRADVREGTPIAVAYPAKGFDYDGPADPADPSRPAICNHDVRRALDTAWGESLQAAHRDPVSINNKVEFGFAIRVDASMHRLSVQPMQTSDLTGNKPNELTISVDQETIATVHTHNTGARPTPSAADVNSEIPAFVKSQFYLFVTIPGTRTYAAIDLKKVCSVDR